MSASVLVAYATRYGSTQEVAEAVAATLRERGLEADIQQQEGEVAGHVSAAQSLAELGAVEDLNYALRTLKTDVLGTKVAMSLPDPPRCCPIMQEIRTFSDEAA